tara:strand:+ start:367 stop:582 length:216 start_codon:yes stop_codon:yes gene_type:complete
MRKWFRRKKNVPKEDTDIEAVVDKFVEELESPKEEPSRLLSLRLFRQKSSAQSVKGTNVKSVKEKEKSKSK